MGNVDLAHKPVCVRKSGILIAYKIQNCCILALSYYGKSNSMIELYLRRVALPGFTHNYDRLT